MASWNEIISAARNFRHDLHRNPELGWNEHRTAEKIRKLLTQLGIPWTACAKTGTLARLNKNAKNPPHIALRADIDALPIKEESGASWSSHADGCMHACGHDGHTATLIAVSYWLKQCEDQLSHPITLLFQPAEEGGHGAREMIKEGALKGIDEIYGWHNWPAIPFAQLACPDHAVMCGNGTFKITVMGKGGHASQPEFCRDPVLAASAINLNLQQIVSRKLAPKQTAVLSVTSIMAPSGETVIPDTASLSGSIRILNAETRSQVNRLIKQISTDTAKSYGVDCEVEIFDRYDATVNHAKQAKNMRSSWQDLCGSHALAQDINLPIMASEDFSYYLKEIPGAFALIGADDGQHPNHSCHSSLYDFNDRLIPEVAKLFLKLSHAPLPPELEPPELEPPELEPSE